VPRDHAQRGAWPTGPLKKGAPPSAAYAQAIVFTLRLAIGDRSISDIARSADVARSTVHDLLAGNTWPDLVTLVKLEGILGVTLWPRTPLRSSDGDPSR
jgi:transcriptional regulator with XRE-family HTH domain